MSTLWNSLPNNPSLKAFREGLLGNEFQSVDMYNSVLGERTVEHVYFTSSYDSDGEYHPFMVIAMTMKGWYSPSLS